MSVRASIPAVVHILVVVLLFGVQFILSEYAMLTLTRIMVIAMYAVGYNVLFGYAGLLSLGHALFFATGLYAAGLPIYYFGFTLASAFAFGVAVSALVSLLVGAVALRTVGVSFMIVTLMFAQVGYLLTSYFIEYTQGDAGLSLTGNRRIDLPGLHLDLIDPQVRYNLALFFLSLALLAVYVMVRRPGGRILVAIRENEDRTSMLGYNTFANKLGAFVVSGTISGTAGVVFALLFGYVGSSFASIQYSVDALLYTLVGGAGSVLGPVLGAGLMISLIDKLSEFTVAYLLFVGLALIALTIWFPKGILGTVRERWAQWLP
ncbi:MAG: branched-chain amino acid ABC transporter permease [Bradyrhizobium sp.]